MSFKLYILNKYKGISCLCIALASIFWTGISILPGNPYFLLATDPTIAHEIQNTYQATPLFSIIAWILQIDTAQWFAIYSLTWCLASFVLLYLYLKRNVEWNLPLVFCILLNHPFAYTQLLWLGLADSAHYCFWLLILLNKKCLPRFILGILAGANHPASLVVAFTFLFSNFNKKEKATLILSAIIGLFTAKLWNYHHQIEIYSRVEYVLDRGIWHPIYNALCNLPTLVFSYQHVCWVLILLILKSIFKTDKKTFITFVILHVIGLCTILATDLTRCFAIVVTPLLFKLIGESELLKSNDLTVKKLIPIIAFTSFITPAIFVWDSSVWTNMFHLHYSNFWEIITGQDYYIPYPTGQMNITNE